MKKSRIQHKKQSKWVILRYIQTTSCKQGRDRKRVGKRKRGRERESESGKKEREEKKERVGKKGEIE